MYGIEKFSPGGGGIVESTLQRAKNFILSVGRSEWTDERLAGVSRAQLRYSLFLTSFLILFVELALIRWTPSQVRYLGFFINFVLMAVFLGIGVGILTGRRAKWWLVPFPVAFFIFVLLLSRFDFQLKIVSNDVLYYGISEAGTGNENFIVLPLIFSLIVLMVAPLGRSLGRLISSLPPLEAYSIDIVGSLAGIAAFFVMSYFALPPLVWFGIVALLYLLLQQRKQWLVAAPLLAGALAVVWLLGANTRWSPYYRIETFPNEYGGLTISVNNIGHQMMAPLEDKENFYYQVYDSFAPHKFGNVLIIGAGSGMDVALALHEGATHIDAAEIDPVLYQIGQESNALNPYADPRVNVVINDGRAFLRTTQQKYDLIIFALPDSLTLTSGFANLRLESFLFTVESLQAARQRLAPDGVLVLYNFYREDWFIDKLASTLKTAFGEPPYVVEYGSVGRAATFIAANHLPELNPALNVPYQAGAKPATSGRGYLLPILGSGLLNVTDAPELARDDWPFMYMQTRTIPFVFLAAIATVLVIAIALVLLVLPRKRGLRFEWHFFALGVAFLLLETRSLVTFSLLFGSTWMVNSLVFFAILLSVLLAIQVNARFPIRNPRWLYVALVASILVNFAIPLQALLNIDNAVLRYGLASVLTFIPVFLANVVFSHSFRDSESADMAFGANLVGAFLGGLMEYSSLLIGYQALLLLALAAYVIAFVLRNKTGAVRLPES